jgi:steroid 5-alpha reductase family enzyme
MLTSAIVILAIVVITWLISLALRDASVIDPVWPLGFVAVAITAFVAGDGDEGRRLLILVLVGLWGLRLSGYLMWRNAGKGEDFRYAAMREKRGPSFWIISLVTIFVLQGVLMWVVSLPVQLAAVPDRGLGWLAAAGGAAWAIGFAFESIGDWQLARFRPTRRTRARCSTAGCGATRATRTTSATSWCGGASSSSPPRAARAPGGSSDPSS